MFSKLLMAGIMAFVLGGSAVFAAGEDVQGLVRRADEIALKGRYLQAIELYERALRANPDNQQIELRLLQAKQMAGTISPSERQILSLLQQQRDAQTELMLDKLRLGIVQARIAISKGRTDRARELIEQTEQLLDQLARKSDLQPYRLQLLRLRKRLPQADVKPTGKVGEEKGGEQVSPPPAETASAARRLVDSAIEQRNNKKNIDDEDERPASDWRYHPVENDWRYRPAPPLVDLDRLWQQQKQRIRYEYELQQALLAREAELIVSTRESALAPVPVMSYPSDWPEKTAARGKRPAGVAAVGPTYKSDSGQQMQTIIYDISDLLIEPPYPQTLESMPLLTRDMILKDRRALRRYSAIFNGYPEDLAKGIPLLQYFGGVGGIINTSVYKPARGEDIVELIEGLLRINSQK